MAKSPAWQRKAGQSKSGGLNAKGRASYKKQTGGTLKPPVSAAKAKSSMKSRLTSDKTANDPNSRINKALRKWDCKCSRK